MNEIYQIPLFEGVSQEELQWLLDNSYEMFLNKGEFFVQANQRADRFYVVLEGELQVTRNFNGVEMVLGTNPRGIIGGEIALLHGTPSDHSICAIVPSHLLVFEQKAFYELFSACTTVGARILQTATERMQMFAAMLQQQEKMAALGKISAGLAHELNNPSAAVRRTAKSLRETLPLLHNQTMKLHSLCDKPENIDMIIRFQQQVGVRASTIMPLSPLEQSDREEDMATWLETWSVECPWDKASCFVSFGITPQEIQTLVANLTTHNIPDVIEWLYQAIHANSLLQEIEQSTWQICDIVTAVKGYTYVDRGELNEVNIHKGLENTLKILNHKLRDITVIRNYASDIPDIQARGGELNQVWTNLIDNAIDAIGPGGTIWVITRQENDYIMVEISDNGTGISPEIQPRLFEPFFTTKDVGEGTGLGLDISYRIIQHHHGTIEVRSEPGLTRFIVRLPIHPSSEL